jgi:hypothetical protein
MRTEERRPPAKLANEAAEIALLGNLINNADALDKVTEHIGADDFYNTRNAMVYSAICMAAIENTTGLAAVIEQLRKDGSLGEVGEPYVRAMTEHACENKDLKTNLAIITELASKRASITAAQALASAVLNGSDETIAFDKLMEVQGKTNSQAVDFSDLEDVAQRIVTGNYKHLEPTILRRSDGQCLLYPGKLNWLAAPPESQKSFIALLACVQQMLDGKPVVFVDFEDNGDTAIERMYKIAVGEQLDNVEETLLSWVAGPKFADGTRDKNKRLFYYMQAGRAFDIRMRSKILQVVRKGAGLVIIDGCAVALSLSGLDENVNGDVNKWISAVSYPITSAGAAVLVIDHVAKTAAPGGGAFANRSARGAGSKLASVSGTALMCEVRQAGSAFAEGEIEITVSKDRPGRLRTFRKSNKRVAGVLMSKPITEGREGVQMRILPADEVVKQAEEKRYDLVCAEHISKIVKELGPISKTEIRKVLKERAEAKGTTGFRTETTVAAMKFLADNSYVRMEKNERQEMLISLVPYEAVHGDVHADDIGYEESPF